MLQPHMADQVWYLCSQPAALFATGVCGCGYGCGGGSTISVVTRLHGGRFPLGKDTSQVIVPIYDNPPYLCCVSGCRCWLLLPRRSFVCPSCVRRNVLLCAVEPVVTEAWVPVKNARRAMVRAPFPPIYSYVSGCDDSPAIPWSSVLLCVAWSFSCCFRCHVAGQGCLKTIAPQRASCFKCRRHDERRSVVQLVSNPALVNGRLTRL